MPTTGHIGSGPYGKSTFGGTQESSFRLLEADSINEYLVVLTFNAPYSTTYIGTFDPANYVVPGLTVSRVTAHPTSLTSLYLHTDKQSYTLYTVTVGTLYNSLNVGLNPNHKSASFTGAKNTPSFSVRVLSSKRIRVQAVEVLLRDAYLLDTASYTVKDGDGVSLAVLEVLPEQSGNVTSLILVLQDSLETTKWYDVEVSRQVQTVTGKSLKPKNVTFQWFAQEPFASVDLQRFTGEVQGGLFGNPLGQVFFSPALEASIANSTIEVDAVEVCTEAYDTYEFPQPIDPNPLYTWSSVGPKTNLGQTGVVLWAAFPRLVDAHIEVSDLRSDTFLTATSSRAIATFTTPFDPAYISLLNNPYWQLSPPEVGYAVFRTANNLVPIPAGATTTVTLEP